MTRPVPGRRSALVLAAVLVTTAGGQAVAVEEDAGMGDVTQTPYERTETVVEAGEKLRIYDPSVGEEEPWYVNDHTFIRGRDGQWHLFGITHPEPADPLDEKFFAHATAGKLTQSQWTKRDPVMHADPEAGESHVWAPHVIWHAGRYWMFYAGGTPDHTAYKIQLATSKDLYNWERYEGNPLFTDGFDGRDPMVLRVGGQWVMYYTANSTPSGGNHIVAYRTSKDLKNWSERKVAFEHPRAGTFGGPTESPFVVKHKGSYYLFVCCDDGYTSTRVYRSDDPLSFDVSQQVGEIDMHASEVIRDKGRWWVSGAGWGQGGVYLRPLDFEGERVTAGRVVETPSYRMSVQTEPAAAIRSMDVRDTDGGWSPVLDSDFRSTAPHLAVGTFGRTDQAGPAAHVEPSSDGGSLTLRGIPLGDEPVTADWRLDFTADWFDNRLTYSVHDTTTAPVWEVAWTVDSALDRVGDNENPDRDSGDVPGFAQWSQASSDSATVAAAYREGSSWSDDNRFVEQPPGAFVWQSLWHSGGRTWEPGEYAGGTWRVGASNHGHDGALGKRLHDDVNASEAR